MSFTKFNFHRHISESLKSQGYVTPTPIQNKVIQPILAGRDLMGLAQTGTGKTAAFVLPILQRLSVRPASNGVKSLIITPTRELAEQIHTYIGKFSKRINLRSCVVYGGVSKQAQINNLRRGADVVIACPGRLLDLAHDGAINFSEVETLVLDEADQMLDRGFLPDIKRIIELLPAKRQNLVFSATMPNQVRGLVNGILINPVEVTADHTRPVTNISHAFYRVDNRRKNQLLGSILKDEKVGTAIVFTRTKYKARSLAQRLVKQGFKATSIQGNLSQQNRQRALDGFKSGQYDILVATDIAARGIDVAGISHIINYDMPGTTEAYTHRTGRTGRANQSGQAFTFATPDDHLMMSDLERLLRGRMDYKNLPQLKDEHAGPRTQSTSKQRPVAPRPFNSPRKFRGKRSSQRNRMASFDFGI